MGLSLERSKFLERNESGRKSKGVILNQKIINEVENRYRKFLNPNFDASAFLKCKNNFALTSHIESIKIFNMDNLPISPTFTIAIPTYNRLETLKEAINSAINQNTDQHYEIIVVENVDSFNEITPTQQVLVKDYIGKITYYKNKKNLGLFGNWNRCLTLARGEWVCILHSDDLLASNYLMEMQKAISLKSNSTLIGCLEKSIGKNQEKQNVSQYFLKFYQNKYSLIRNWVYGNSKKFFSHRSQRPIKFLSPSCVLHNKKKCIKIGGYCEDEFPIGDNFFHTRAFLNGEITTIMKTLYFKNSDISIGLNPSVQLGYCFIVPPYLRATLSKQTWQYVAYSYISYIKENLIQDKELQTYIDSVFLSNLNSHKPLFSLAFYKMIFICKNIFRLKN